MFGFIGAVIPEERKIDLVYYSHENVDTIYNEYNDRNYQIVQLTLDKFKRDKVFYYDDEIIILLEGVVYNFIGLEKKFGITDRGKLLKKLYNKTEIEKFADMLNGYFSFVIIDKIKKVAYLVTDQISYRPIWYFYSNHILLFSTDIAWLYKTIKKNDLPFALDCDGAFCLLNYGYMLGDITLVNGVKKLLAGNIAIFDHKEIRKTTYFQIPDFENRPLLSAQKYDEILQNIDFELKNSVKNAYLKDDEYGYKHIITLSGGLDSRIILFISVALGFQSTCITMGESQCKDLRISSEICDSLRQEHIIYELNNGLYLDDIESAIESNGGTILWPGFAHCYRLLSNINLDGYGAVHSGDLGDAVLGGSLVGRTADHKISIDSLLYSSKFIDGFSESFKQREIERYPDQYHFNYYNRGLNSAGNGCFAAQRFTECSSPFISKEMINISFHIPQKNLQNHRLYIDYMKKFLPHACDFIWEKTGCRPGTGEIRKYAVSWLRKVQHHLLHKSISMNPFDKWYRENIEMRNYLDRNYRNSIRVIEGNKLLQEAVTEKYKSKYVMDKTLACLLLRTIDYYDIDLC